MSYWDYFGLFGLALSLGAGWVALILVLRSRR